MIRGAEEIAGLSLTDAERELMVDNLEENLEAYQTLRHIPVGNEIGPATRFDPTLPGMAVPKQQGLLVRNLPEVGTVPQDLEEVAFWPVTHLARLLEQKRVTSLELTRMYLDRLKRYGPSLNCVITLTEDLAIREARRADLETEAGRYRGPLHGIPWGAKDLLAARGYPTTWGAKPFQHRKFYTDSTVVERLREAGAVLVAKLSVGALASGDDWFGGETRNPWNPDTPSGGSSAGPAAATSAGLVGFSIGSPRTSDWPGSTRGCGCRFGWKCSICSTSEPSAGSCRKSTTISSGNSPRRGRRDRCS